MCSPGYCHAFLLSIAGVDGLEQPNHTSDRQQESMTIQGCTYSFISSWWWAEKPPETCRSLIIIKNIVWLHLVGYIKYTNKWLFHPWAITWNYLYTPAPPHTHTKTYYVWWLNDVIHVIQRVHFEISRVSYRLCLRVTYSNGGCWLNRGDGSVLDTWHELRSHVEACEFIDSDTWGWGQNSAVLLTRSRLGSFTDE